MINVYNIIVLLLLSSSTIFSLPIFTASSVPSSSSFALISSSIISSTSTAILQQQNNEISLIEETTAVSLPIEEEEKCPNTEYGIPVERFAQLVSTHWQFDHLDSIKSGTYKIISEQFQKHIEISIEPITVTEQPHPLYTLPTRQQKSFNTIAFDMMMDLEILHAQIFGAIQAHTEGSLHIAWDRLSDKLGQPAFEQFIRTVALNHCTFDQEKGLLSSTCLKDKASQLSLELDEYINLNLNHIFIALELEVLPKLLSNTSKDLDDVLAYFNRLFLLKDHQRLYLKVTPWDMAHSHLKEKLLGLLNKSIDNHLTDDFFENYACLSRA